MIAATVSANQIRIDLLAWQRKQGRRKSLFLGLGGPDFVFLVASPDRFNVRNDEDGFVFD
jgi:hypothetical protein